MSDLLVPCSSCHRHVASDEPACPFCGVQLPAAAPTRALLPGRFSRAAVFAGATLAGCWTNSNEPPTTPIEQHDDTAKGSAKPLHVETNNAEKHHVDVAGAPGRIEGTMTESGTGLPAAGIEIVLTNAQTRQTDLVHTDMNGHYVFEKLAPGSYRLTWGSNNPRQNRSVLQATVAEGARIKLDLTVFTPQNNSNIPMPYGAPPARYRVV